MSRVKQQLVTHLKRESEGTDKTTAHKNDNNLIFRSTGWAYIIIISVSESVSQRVL